MKPCLSNELCGGEEVSLDAGHVDDLKKAAKKMRGAERRVFQAEMSLKAIYINLYTTMFNRPDQNIPTWQQRISLKSGFHLLHGLFG